VVVVFAFGLVACSTSPPTSSSYVAGFDPGATPTGYVRYTTPAVYKVQPGQDIVLCTWVAGASEKEIDVADVTGKQSLGGHHVVLYASMNTSEPLGVSRDCTPLDREGVQFLGAIGGEGSANVTLPAGMVFRLPKGRSLMANVHYINATQRPFDAQSVVDVKYTPTVATAKVAAMLVMNQSRFQVPALQSYKIDGYCSAPKDMSLIMFTDHVHEHGTSIFNELVRADGSKEMLASDDSWTRDLIFNPHWKRWDVAQPLVVKAGDQLHVHCEWQNTLDRALRFPDEMCIGLGFFTEGGEQVVCNAS